MLRIRAGTAAVLMLLTTGLLAIASPAAAQPQVQALPTPLRFVSNLDLECFRTNAYTPPPTTILTRHINPVLTGLPVENVTLGPREQLCVPVRKNNATPPADVLAFIRFVDLSCYRIQGINVNKALNLRHLNPLLQTLPARNVVITVPQHLCVPVVKNGQYPPAEVRRLVQYIDLKCYLEQPQAPLGIGLTLAHLNPVLSHLPPHNASVTYNRQLCVPVQKNNQPIPADIFNIIRWLDMEKFDIATPALPNPVNLGINHINPSLIHLPTEPVTLFHGFQLALPMAKNGMIPPG